MSVRHWLIGLGSVLLWSAAAFAQQEALEEIVVQGRSPGPALWKVTKDGNVLWIFGHLTPTPKAMIWDPERVAEVIARADEFIAPPDAHLSVAPLVKLNPVNYVRAYRLSNRLARNPGRKSLRDVVPPDLYQRITVLKALYLPADGELETLRPTVAAERVMSAALKANGLTTNDAVMKKIMRMIDANRHIRRTSTDVTTQLAGSYGALAERAETLVKSLPPEQEIACTEFQVSRVESGIPAMQRYADSWAQGHVDELREAPRFNDVSNPCFNLILASSEVRTAEAMVESTQRKWLEAAEHALATNHSTFAVLGIDDLFSGSGLLAQLKSRGYAVTEPR